MTFTAADLDQAVDKLSAAEFTDAEVEALASVIAGSDDVQGFAHRPESKGWIIIESIKPPTTAGLLGDDLGILRGDSYKPGGGSGTAGDIVAQNGTGSI